MRLGPTPPVDTSTPGAAIAAGPNSAAGPSYLAADASLAAGASPAATAVVDPNAPAARPSVAVPASPAPAAVQGSTIADVEGSSSVAPTQRRYHTRVGPTPPAPSHPRPAQRAPPPKKARTSGLGESSTLRPQVPPSPSYQGIAEASDLSPASIIRRPYFPYSPIQGNVDCRGRDFHREVYYDLPAFAEDPKLRDSMLLV